MVQLAHLYITNGKTRALTIWTSVGKVMSLIFNMLSRFAMGFPDVAVVKNPPTSAGDTGLIHGSGRCPGVGNGRPLQYSCPENSTGRGA